MVDHVAKQVSVDLSPFTNLIIKTSVSSSTPYTLDTYFLSVMLFLQN